jgi:hypothetical protein
MPSAYQEEILLSSGLKLYIDPSYRPQFTATVTGTAQFVPAKYQHKIKPSDELLFSFQVVADRSSNQPEEVFYLVDEDKGGYFQKWISNKGNTLVKNAVKKVFSYDFVAYLWDKKLGFVEGNGVQGSEEQVNEWLTRFDFTSEVKYTHNNLLDVDGEDYWKVDMDDIFAKIVDGELVPVGNRLILEPIDISADDLDRQAGKLVLPDMADGVSFRLYDRGKIVHDYEPLGLKKGDVVGFDERFLEKYEINSKQYFLIKPRRALGIYVEKHQ